MDDTTALLLAVAAVLTALAEVLRRVAAVRPGPYVAHRPASEQDQAADEG